MGSAALIGSVLLLLVVALRCAARAPVRSDRFWIFIAALTLQIGVLTLASSALRRYEPWTILVMQVVLAVGVLVWRAPSPPSRNDEPRLRCDGFAIAMLIAIGVLLALAAMRQALMPLSSMDDQGYHAPRIAYWLQNRSVFIRPSHDYRQTIFPFGAEMIAGWPLLFVKAEWPVRMAFWLCYPLSCAGVYSLCRAVGAGGRASLAGALLFAATPTIASHSVGLKADAWLPLYLCGACYGAIRPRADGELPGRRFLLAGLFLAMAANVKTTSLALGPGLLIAAVIQVQGRVMLRSVAGLCAGFATGAIASGLAFVLAANLRRYGNLMGPEIILEIVRPHHSVQQMWVHAVRTVFFLAEPPEAPIESARAWLETTGNDLATRLGATVLLPDENPKAYPGAFRYSVRTAAVSYALGGMLWLPALIGGGAIALRDVVRSWPRPRMNSAALLAVVQLPLFLALVFMVRWMQGGPGRFWVGGYALVVPVIAYAAGRWAARSTVVAALALLGLIAAVVPAVRTGLAGVDYALVHPATEDSLKSEFREVVPLIGDNARILLFAHGQTREHSLFRPRHGYTNAVIPWGMSPFEPARVQALIDRERITHVVLERDTMAGYAWPGPMSEALLAWLQSNPQLREVPLATAKMHLFVRTSAAGD